MRAAKALLLLAAAGCASAVQDEAPSASASSVPAAAPAPAKADPFPAPAPAPAAKEQSSDVLPDAAEKRDRRERLAWLAGKDAAVLVLSADESPGFSGSTQNLDFTYLSPFDARGAAVLVSVQGAALDDRLYLRPRNSVGEMWTGPVAGPGPATKAAGLFAAAHQIDRLASDVAEVVRGKKTLYVSAGGPADGARVAAPLLAALRAKLAGTWVRVIDGPAASADDYAESVRRALPEKFPRDKTSSELLAALPVLDVKSAWRLTAELREVKSAAEIASVRAAVDATVGGMLDALRAARPGMMEMQVAGYVEVHCRFAGCARMAYPSIVGTGSNSCVLHYAAGERRLADGEIVVMDIGGEYRGYAADVTRSFPANGKFTAEQARIYDAVLAAQEAGIEAVKPGATIRNVHDAAYAVLKERGLAQHFPHGTSHSVGLDVHDPFRPDTPLRVGSILTVEPGVYVAADALGVRIEDTVLVTETGREVLSAGVPKTREGIEKLMAESAR